MTTINHICDRCREPIRRDRTTLEVGCGPHHGRRDDIDLCGPCMTALLAWVDAPVMAAPPLGARMAKVG